MIQHQTLCGVLIMCMPDDELEDSDSIRETMAYHANGFALLWHMLRVIVEMIDTHVVPKLQVCAGSLAKHTGCWDVHQLMMTHRWMRFTQEDFSVAFLWSVVCPRFGPVAKVELGILQHAIPKNVKCGATWVMPGKYEV